MKNGKKIALLAASLLLSVSAYFSAYAGEWKEDASGWWYDNGDSTYAKDGWNWIDGKCYYFTSDGYCLTDTQTPDGQTVGPDGAWTIDGHVVGNPAVYKVRNLTLTVPEDMLIPLTSNENYSSFLFHDLITGIGIYDYNLEEISHMSGAELSAELNQMVLDHMVIETYGVYDSKESKQLMSGTWNCYKYASMDFLNYHVPGSVYVRMSGSDFQMVFFTGSLDHMALNEDMLMNICVR